MVFCTAFGALFPSVVLWLENVAGYSAIATGVAILPGPLMVPLFAMVGQRLARRMPAGALVAVGNLVFCLGAVMLAWNASAQARFATDVLPGWIVTGVGIGLALPTLMAAATAGLPPAQAATGSAVVNTGRQLGTSSAWRSWSRCSGTLDTPHPGATTGFAGAWWFIAGAAGLGAVTALGLTSRRRMVYSH
ncbi:MFS transporter [Amycolatopsis thermoflava]|uniref:MFS transporter n=1 Tax=Amycolatopsis thermoflava TaxID=84480 RepID=UPI003817F68C